MPSATISTLPTTTRTDCLGAFADWLRERDRPWHERDALLANLQQVQADLDLHNSTPIPVSPELGSRDFSIEMETGKTYVYLRTALELYKNYGFHKFIVVVPSVAIRERVLKTRRIMREHFAGLYDTLLPLLPVRFGQPGPRAPVRDQHALCSQD